MLGVIFGISFAAIIVLLIELRNKNIRSLQEIKQRFNYTILGALPLIDKHDISNNPEFIYPDVTVLNAPQSPISEIYRIIQANLKFFYSEETIKTLVVTSTVAQEGKSLVSANLAAAISQLGKRVLIIDANMRSPDQHNIWKVPNDRGLSNVLLGKNDFYNSGWHITNELDIITSGSQTANPLALIDSQQMDILISELQSQYDMIIIDAPSFMVTADAFTLGKMSDGILLVARPGVIDYDSTTAGQEILRQSGQNILGVVVNGLIKGNEPNNHFSKNYKYYLTNQDISGKQQLKKQWNILSAKK